MKSNKKPATGPSTEGSVTTPHRQEALTDKAKVAKEVQKHDSAGSNDIEDGEDDDMHSDDSMDMMRLDSEICLPRGKSTQIWNLEPLMAA